MVWSEWLAHNSITLGIFVFLGFLIWKFGIQPRLNEKEFTKDELDN